MQVGARLFITGKRRVRRRSRLATNRVVLVEGSRSSSLGLGNGRTVDFDLKVLVFLFALLSPPSLSSNVPEYFNDYTTLSLFLEPPISNNSRIRPFLRSASSRNVSQRILLFQISLPQHLVKNTSPSLPASIPSPNHLTLTKTHSRTVHPQ